MTTVEVLKAARTRIERKGWGREYEGSGIPRESTTECAGVALDRAQTRSGTDYHHVMDLFRAGAGIRHGSIIAWNDAPGRTQAQVLSAFDAAIALADAATSRDAAGMK